MLLQRHDKNKPVATVASQYKSRANHNQINFAAPMRKMGEGGHYVKIILSYSQQQHDGTH